jgi:hypothetical protein
MFRLPGRRSLHEAHVVENLPQGRIAANDELCAAATGTLGGEFDRQKPH